MVVRKQCTDWFAGECYVGVEAKWATGVRADAEGRGGWWWWWWKGDGGEVCVCVSVIVDGGKMVGVERVCVVFGG